MQQIKKKLAKGLLDPDTDDPFELFISSTSIRYCYYSESHKIMGATYGMCILQVKLQHHLTVLIGFNLALRTSSQ